MSSLSVKVVMMLALPLAIFLGGLRVMSKMSDRDYVTRRLRQSADPKDQRPLNQRPGYDVGAVNRYWGALDDTARQAGQRFVELDPVFPFLYGAALSAGLLIAWATLGRPFHPVWLMAPVTITVLADRTENLVQLGQFRRYIEGGAAGLQPGWNQITSTATVLKLLFFLGTSQFVVGFVVSVIIPSLRPT